MIPRWTSFSLLLWPLCHRRRLQRVFPFAPRPVAVFARMQQPSGLECICVDIFSAPFHILILAESNLNGGTNVGSTGFSDGFYDTCF